MSPDFPLILVWGQSYFNRLCAGLERGFAATGSWRFNLASRARVILFHQGGRTVPKLWSHDLHVSRSPLDIAILEIGTYDLSTEDPALVASSIEVSVRFFRRSLFGKGDTCVSCHLVVRHVVDVCNDLVHKLLESHPYIVSG